MYIAVGLGRYDTATDVESLDAYAHMCLGINDANSGQYNQAIQKYDGAVRLDPDNSMAYFNRGLAYHKSGRHDRATQDYGEA